MPRRISYIFEFKSVNT